MGKKVKRKTYVSKGERRNVSTSTLRATAHDVPQIDRSLNIVNAWRAGKNPWITVKGPDKSRAWIKVRANTVYGDPKKTSWGIYRGKSDE